MGSLGPAENTFADLKISSVLGRLARAVDDAQRTRDLANRQQHMGR